mgnify:CR=1 FL=1
MKILLIEAPYNYGAMKVAISRHFPLGLAYVASYLKKNLWGSSIELFLEDFDKNFYILLKKRLVEFAPDLIGISAMTPSFYAAYEIAKFIKKESDTPIVLGGQHASALKKENLSCDSPLDFIVYGEGEQTMLELCEKLRNSSADFDNISGLIFKKNGIAVENPPRTLINKLDNVPFPARELTDLKRFGTHSYIKFGKNSATIISSRGCAYNCVFCASNLTMGRKYRFHSAEYVTEEIKELTGKYKIDSLVFVDDTLTQNRHRLENICRNLIQDKIHVYWYCLSRIDTIDYDVLKLMKEAGCRMVTFGIESGNQKMLEIMNKNLSLSKAKKVIDDCKKLGLRSQCTYIIGFPGENSTTMCETYKFAKSLGPTITIFFPFIPYPGTKIFDTLPEDLKPESPDEWKKFLMTSDLPIASFIEGCSRKKLALIIKLYTLRFYLRPKQIAKILNTIQSRQDLFEMIKSFFLLVVRLIK